jgi:hypothetical protein
MKYQCSMIQGQSSYSKDKAIRNNSHQGREKEHLHKITTRQNLSNYSSAKLT